MIEALWGTAPWWGLAPAGWFTLAVVAGAMTLMLLDKLGPDLVMFSALSILVVAGVVDPAGAMAGFSDSSTATVGVLFVVAKAVQETGAMALVSSMVFAGAKSVSSALVRLVVPTAVLSAFLNNTPLVAMLIPVTSGIARRMEVNPSKLMMPLSFAAVLGGTCTLIGTSTNLVSAGLMTQAGMDPMGMFEIGWVGVPTAIVGVIYLLTVGRRLLPDRADPFTSARANAREYLAEVEVAGDSPLVGRTVEGASLRHLPGLFLAEIRRRDGEVISPVAPEDRLEPHDHLVFTGLAGRIADLTSMPGLVPTNTPPVPGQGLYEVVISHGSGLVGRSVRGSQFRRKFDAAILAVHRAGERIEGRIGDIVLRPGDTLMLSASPGFDLTFREHEDFYLVSEVPSDGQPRYQKAPIALAALAVMVLVPTITGVSMLVSSMAALVFLLGTQSVSPRAARDSVNWPILLLIASSFGVSEALTRSGAANAVAGVLVSANELLGPMGLLAAVYLVSTVLTAVISNAAAVAIVFPIVLATADAADLAARPYVFALTMAASAAFASPIGYQTHMMVYGPGGYRFQDFVRVGLPLNVLCFAVAMLVIPQVWPLLAL